MELDEIYFYTATIKDWIPLFNTKYRKQVLIDSLKYLVDKKLIVLYGFVIMPNHVHFLWELISMNGKEMPHASFMKYTSHTIQKELEATNPGFMSRFRVDSDSRKYQFWQSHALPFHLFSPRLVYQKLEYIHNNPVQGKWMLADSPIDYPYSSASFYESGVDSFGMLTHIGERI